MPTPSYKVMDLIPPIRKHTFAPDIDPSNLIDDEAEFPALHGFDCSKPNFQTVEEEEELARDEPEAYRQQDQQEWTARRVKDLSFDKTLDLMLAHGAM